MLGRLTLMQAIAAGADENTNLRRVAVSRIIGGKAQAAGFDYLSIRHGEHPTPNLRGLYRGGGRLEGQRRDQEEPNNSVDAGTSPRCAPAQRLLIFFKVDPTVVFRNDVCEIAFIRRLIARLEQSRDRLAKRLS